jgi:hypothetical protein
LGWQLYCLWLVLNGVEIPGFGIDSRDALGGHLSSFKDFLNLIGVTFSPFYFLPVIFNLPYAIFFSLPVFISVKKVSFGAFLYCLHDSMVIYYLFDYRIYYRSPS